MPNEKAEIDLFRKQYIENGPVWIDDTISGDLGYITNRWEKFMRTHKRLKEVPPPIAGDVVLHEVLLGLKHRVDSQVLSYSHLLDNEPYFMQGMFPMIKQELDRKHVKYSAAQIRYISTCISNEYFAERNFAS